MGRGKTSALAVPFILFLFKYCAAVDSITRNQPLKDGHTIVSPNRRYEMGFFSPGKSRNRYVGIWYKDVPIIKPMWIANRENPVTDSSGVLTIDSSGNLAVLDGNQATLWSSNVSVSSVNSTAKLLDSQNLILREEISDDGRTLWESFDHPTDSYIRLSKSGINLNTGERQSLTSWKSADDPAKGNFSVSINPRRPVQIFMYNGSRPYWRTGQWNGRTFPIIPEQYAVNSGLNLVNDVAEGTLYITFTTNVSDYPRLNVVWSGQLQLSVWSKSFKKWMVAFSVPSPQCDVYGTCGPNGVCNQLGSPICGCLKGFLPKNFHEWNNGNWTSGCVRRKAVDCKRDGFLGLSGVMLPDLNDWSIAENFSVCRSRCLKNCSCLAYAYNVGMGCLAWGRELIDVKELSEGRGVDLYVRLDHSELHAVERGKTSEVIILVTISLAAVIFLVPSASILWRRMAKQSAKKKNMQELNLGGNMDSPTDSPDSRLIGGKGNELRLFDLDRVVRATSNFATANKLGEGGFGPVYKGKLREGKDITVKRLSRSSGQGLHEFKNEVIMISKLRHRNLVTLLGCCIDEEEKLLIYEFMANKSLDAHLFDPTKRKILDWPKRFHIVEGIARGLLYLHRDSRLKIIHRDLKASNILLDAEMNPKISDFGMAKIFGGKQTLANTNRVVGTYGYMAPEYAMAGRFSEKSDVFSFGVLLLEIVSSKKNSSFYHYQEYQNLLGYVWKLWKEENLLELIDPSIGDSYSTTEVLRCIQIGLLCVQEFAEDRPNSHQLF